MKHKNIFFILLLLCTWNASTNNLQRIFDQATAAFYKHDFKKSIELYKEVLAQQPYHPQALFNIGYAHSITGDQKNAILCYQQALDQFPEYAKAHLFLAQELYKQKEYNLALEHINHVIALGEFLFDAHVQKGKMLYCQKNFSASQEAYETALQLNPNDLNTILEFAYQLVQTNQFERAAQLYRTVVEKEPSNEKACYNLAHTLKCIGHMEEAIHFYEQALKLCPDHECARLGLAKAYLATGNLSQGWELFEWRMADQKKYRQEFHFHHLKPHDLKGKTILLRAEWGLGDTIHFIRYAKQLKDIGVQKIIVQTFTPLIPLFTLCPYIDIVFSKDSPIPCAYDVQIPLLSLPLLFETTLTTIPAPIPYLWAHDDLIATWKKKLEPYNKKLRVGLCWQAKPHIFIEKNPLTKRAIPLKEFAPLAEVKGVSFFSLQQQFGTEQLNDLPDNFIVHDFGPDFDTTNGRFMDTAAVIQNLDLIISVDTAIVHLAGALGKPVWVLIPSVAEWRWMTQGDMTPWYPNAQLFRKPHNGTWDDVIHTIKDALNSFVAKKRKNDEIF